MYIHLLWFGGPFVRVSSTCTGCNNEVYFSAMPSAPCCVVVYVILRALVAPAVEVRGATDSTEA